MKESGKDDRSLGEREGEAPSPYHLCPQGLSGNTMLGVGHVVTTSIGMCDIDIRPVRPDPKAWQRDLGLRWRKKSSVCRLTLLPALRVSMAVSLSLAATLCFRGSQTDLIGSFLRRPHR